MSEQLGTTRSRGLKKHWFSIVSRVLAAYFFWVFHLHVGFPPTEPLTGSATTVLGIAIFLLVLPFAQRLKLGKLIEFEAKVERVEAEVKEVRTETRELISSVSAVATAISASVNQSVVVNLPDAQQREVARKEMSKGLTHPSARAIQLDDINEYLNVDGSDIHYGLARLRIDLEREMRRILGKRLEVEDPTESRVKFLNVRSLFARLISAQRRFRHMESSLDYVLKVCNAAIHGQRVSDGVAREAIGMGLRMLRELENEEVI